jgi:hypothetical protein
LDNEKGRGALSHLDNDRGRGDLSHLDNEKVEDPYPTKLDNDHGVEIFMG